MNHLSLFSGGCDGFSLAAEWMGWTNVAHVEIDKWNQKLLKQNFPESKVYGDIREFNRTEAAKYRGCIDIITGGFPCQPFSSAGKREGTEDDRYLWPEMLETIRAIQPAFVVGENVAGLTTMENGETFERICASLEDEGYTVESFVLPAASVGAWHRRDRIWIIAYSLCSAKQPEPGRCKGQGREYPHTCESEVLRQEWGTQEQTFRPDSEDGIASNSTGKGLQDWGGTQMGRSKEKPEPERLCNTTSNRESIRIQGQRTSGEQEPQTQARKVLSRGHPEGEGQSYWEAEPGVGRMVHGIPNRTHRIKALGNAVVPQVVYEIFKAIEVLTQSTE